MTQYVFDNNAVSTLGSDLGSSATTLTVAVGTGTGFPSPSGGQVVPLTLIAAGSNTDVPNEIVYATARTGDTFTIVRGQEGTTPQSWSTGDTVANMATAAFYNSQATQAEIQIQAGNFADDTGAANAGVIALNPAAVSLSEIVGVPIRVLKMANPNTGAYTLNVNGLGAEPVTLGGVAMSAAQLPGSHIFEVMWDGSGFELLSTPAAIANPNLAQMAMDTIKANITGSPATPQDVSLSNFLTFLGLGVGNLNATKGHIVFPILVGSSVVKVALQWVNIAPFGPGGQAFTWDVTFLTLLSAIPGNSYGLNFSGSASVYLYPGLTTISGGTAVTNNGASTPMGVTIWAIGTIA